MQKYQNPFLTPKLTKIHSPVGNEGPEKIGERDITSKKEHGSRKV